MRKVIIAMVGIVLAIPVIIGIGSNTPKAVAATHSTFLYGTRSTAQPPKGGRTIWVSAKTGYDWILAWYYPRSTCLSHGWATISPHQSASCTPADKTHPLKSLKEAVKIARPGDVIVVRGGTYKDSWILNGVKGSASKKVVIQAYPGENVYVHGFIQLRDSNYWTIEGLRFIFDPAYNKGTAAVVLVEGGSHWTFTHNEIYKTVGTSNLGVVKGRTSIPENFLISWNFIHGSVPSKANIRTRNGQFHNIYVSTTTKSHGGVIERNLVLGAPHGTNIKLAGGKNRADSSAHVVVRYNTLGWAQFGVIIGQRCANNHVYNNIISNPVAVSNPSKQAAIDTYTLSNPSSNHVSGNRVSGYKKLVLYQQGSMTKAKLSGKVGNFFSGGLTGSWTDVHSHPRNARVASQAGMLA